MNSKGDIVLVDMDHTLSDARWRDHMITESMREVDWQRYHSLCGTDPVFEPVAAVVRALRLCGAQIYVVTARPKSFRVATEGWLVRNHIDVDALYMRDIGDRTPSARLKPRQILHHLPVSSLARVRLIIDDREDVIEEFAKIGICGLKVVMS